MESRMRWQIEVATRPGVPDSLGRTIERKLRALGVSELRSVSVTRLFLVEGPLGAGDADRLAQELLSDPVVDVAAVHDHASYEGLAPGTVSVFKKPGVMDPVEGGILRGARALGIPVERARTGHRYRLEGVAPDRLVPLAEAVVANPAIEIVVADQDRFPDPPPPRPRPAGRREIPLRAADDQELLSISRAGGLSLDLLEMQAIAAHFRQRGRDPTEIELETLAQTWSEHCKHKTFTSPVRYEGPPVSDLADGAIVQNLLRSTIKEATRRLARPYCLSVFEDNAGVIHWEGPWALCFKVETHNHPSAIEPYGGAGTGVGGVIRDILGTGLGARPIASTDVFCVAPCDLPHSEVPRGALHPLRVLRGVVAGVRDYGNQMGIPTVNGAVLFDRRYVGNPLVFCGTVGLLPVDRVHKEVHQGDLILVVGGPTGRDGIHGATFSSAELHEASDVEDTGAVQIGNAITEKKVLDVVLAARDRGLFRAITDCGAGGFSSAVGEMAAGLGARVHLDRAPLKYEGLSPTEVWISESQERMVLAVPPGSAEALLSLAASEDVPAFVLGEFTGSGRLELLFEGEFVGDLDLDFLHHGLPGRLREATWSPPVPPPAGHPPDADPEATILRLLATPTIASKEWIIRQYDHEVQAASVVKPLVGTRGQGPSDGAVLAPVLGSTVGLAVACGIQPWLGDIDPYAMAWAAVDEALRNVVSVGGDPGHAAILDNFAWGNCSKPDRLGALVRAAYGCRDAALAFGVPFISGKDSLNNEFQAGDTTIVIPHTLLISAMARVPDVRRAVTMDLKGPGHAVVLLGRTGPEMGGSAFDRLFGRSGGAVAEVDPRTGPRVLAALHAAQRRGHVLACHDLSDGGLAVAAAEMVLAGEVGLDLALEAMPFRGDPGPDARLFGECPGRFLVELAPGSEDAFAAAFADLPAARVGTTTKEARLRIREQAAAAPIVDLEAATLEVAFREPLSLELEGRLAEEAPRG
jgi:phosphoribosylformylglycinamidine synthase II